MLPNLRKYTYQEIYVKFRSCGIEDMGFESRLKETIFLYSETPRPLEPFQPPTHWDSGFGGLVVSMLASGTQDRGFEPGRSRQIFRAKKIHSMPSFGGELQPSVPCRRFAARKRTLRFTWKSESQAKLTGHFSPNSVLH
jgi:hypothetical protein